MLSLAPLGLLRHIPAPVVPITSQFTPACEVAVKMESDAIGFMQVNLYDDMERALFDPKFPFSTTKLLEIKALLPPDEEVEYVVMKPSQSLLLYEYAAYYYRRAIVRQQYGMAELYSLFMDDCLPGVLISFQR